MNFLKLFFLTFILVTYSSQAFSQEAPPASEKVDYSPILSQEESRTPNKIENQRSFLHFSSTEDLGFKKNLFFQTNVGAGFLYFSGLRANLMGEPVTNFLFGQTVRDAPLKGRLSYNRTPLFEYLIGYQFNHWFKLAFSYQHQSGITIQSKVVSTNPYINDASATYGHQAQLASHLSLDALLAKVYFELPFACIMGNLAINPYLALGVGPGWQSWTQIEVTYMNFSTSIDYNASSLPLAQKISTNAVWMIDTGLRVQGAYPQNQLSVLLGCKYNQWGQARNIGKMSQQGAHKLALNQPLRIKTVYQFAPYIGVQWNFSPPALNNKSYTLNGKSRKAWIPYVVYSGDFQCSKQFWTQFNAGLGFLYFSGLTGNLSGRPTGNFSPWGNAPLKGRLSYNPTPLLDYLIGFQFNHWLKLALSYQHQGEISIQSKALSAPNTEPPSSEFIQFSSNLNLDALLAKVYLDFPFACTWLHLSMNPYLALGFGSGWQSWTQVQIDYMSGNANYTGNSLPLAQKISANVVWMIDTGLRVQGAYPQNQLSVLLGCKYNQWGQARNIGKMSQQGAHKLALNQPLRIKTVYQFAPYIGVQWNFSPPALNNKSYTLNGKSPKAWLPYVVYSGDFQCSKQFWTQFNAGLGFLYFSGLQGNLAYSKDNTTKIIFNNAPLKGRLSYNRTPLFDYLIGFQFNHWLKLALSYQHQGQISIQSKALSAFTIGLPASEFIQFTSNLSLDALLAKVYFEFPFASIWRSLSINPYLALGVGPGWQSWTKVRVVGMDGNTSFSSASVNLRQKTSANAVWMFDIGFRLQSAYPNSRFSVLMGCKYNQWGQARNIGKGSQLGDLNNPPPFFAINNEFEVQLLVPVRIKTVYQWAPYLGVQWSF